MSKKFEFYDEGNSKNNEGNSTTRENLYSEFFDDEGNF